MREVVFIAPLPAMRKRTRLSKMVPQVLGAGYDILFYGWERECGEVEKNRTDSHRVREKIILRGGGYASKRARLMYPIWMIMVFFCVLKLGRNRLIFALGWETAFPAQLAALFTRSQVVFDDADRFSMILRLPGPAHVLLQRLEKWTSRQVAVHIIPSFSRYDWYNNHMVVLRNSPLAADLADARAAALPRPANKLVLYANGWIGETRGAPVFVEALDIAAERGLDLHLLIAGRVDGEAAPKLIGHPNVTFYGELSQREALAWYTACDAVLTYYDPAIPINRKAEANKWGDAIYFDCPIIVNSEVETMHHFIEAGAAFSVPYDDAFGLVALWEHLMANPEALSRAKSSLYQFKSDYPIFDLQFDMILKHLIPRVEAI